MPKPPPSPPPSDIEGVDRDWRPGIASEEEKPHSTETLKNAKNDSTARPEETKQDPDNAS